MDEGVNHPQIPNAYAKQRSICTRQKKCHGTSALTIRCPNDMSTVAGIVSTKNWDGTILTCSGLNNIIQNLCIHNNLTIYFFCADNGFFRAWLAIRTPHRGTPQFPLNNIIHKENEIMKKSGLELNGKAG